MTFASNGYIIDAQYEHMFAFFEGSVHVRQKEAERQIYVRDTDTGDSRQKYLRSGRMERKDVKCPLCGHINRGVDLAETNGWVECEHCGNDFVPRECLDRVMRSTYSVLYPDKIAKLKAEGNKEKQIS